ncbi:uncharacterized protein VTP21DRAFT_9857 [Calcarisporiella thermophila]|uniref:uncharacterized protein n=1 Tax=Calcarisporiella thermophila TaxID=911321 RepID=UPI0037426F5C
MTNVLPIMNHALNTSRSHQPSHSDGPLRCLWKDCTREFDDAELLYMHACNDHVGRKSTNNLCLTCKWDGCEVSTVKRDHLTSHLRVHVPLKPHSCSVCGKAFKRPQDLKKHEKIHTEAHQETLRTNSHRITSFNYHPLTPPHYTIDELSPSLRSSRSSPGHAPPSPHSIISGGASPQTEFSDRHSSYRAAMVDMPNPSNFTYSLNAGTKRAFNQADLLSDFSNANQTPPANMHLQQADVLNEFFGVVKNKRLRPEYNQDMATRLTRLQGAMMFDSLGEFMPAAEVLQNEKDLSELGMWLTELSQNIEFENGINFNVGEYPSASPLSSTRKKPAVRRTPVQQESVATKLPEDLYSSASLYPSLTPSDSISTPTDNIEGVPFDITATPEEQAFAPPAYPTVDLSQLPISSAPLSPASPSTGFMQATTVARSGFTPITESTFDFTAPSCDMTNTSPSFYTTGKRHYYQPTPQLFTQDWIQQLHSTQPVTRAAKREGVKLERQPTREEKKTLVWEASYPRQPPISAARSSVRPVKEKEREESPHSSTSASSPASSTSSTAPHTDGAEDVEVDGLTKRTSLMTMAERIGKAEETQDLGSEGGMGMREVEAAEVGEDERKQHALLVANLRRWVTEAYRELDIRSRSNSMKAH